MLICGTSPGTRHSLCRQLRARRRYYRYDGWRAVRRAPRRRRIALALGAHDSAAMAAGVEQAVHLAGLIAAEDHRPAGDPARAEVAGIFQLGGVADINPAAAEDRRHLLAQNVVGDEHFAVEQESLSLAVVDDVGACRHIGSR